MTLTEALVIATVEGLTEFLPVSSTGHMIVAEKLLGVESSDFTKLYTVGIQLGAIVSVVVLYWNRFLEPLRTRRWDFYGKLMIAVLPALVLGFVLSDTIDALLDSPLTVAVSLIVGGCILLFIDRLFRHERVGQEEGITPRTAFRIGLWQCLALIPGVSRSAASIIGGMQQQLTRRLAAEFSFFLAVPTMAAATGYKLLKGYSELSTGDIRLFAVGNTVAFVVALLAIRFFIGFLQRHGFRLFGYYRILAGLVLLALILLGQLPA